LLIDSGDILHHPPGNSMCDPRSETASLRPLNSTASGTATET